MTRMVPQPFIYDQIQYEEYANKIYNAPFMLASHTYRTYPAPLLFAIVYKLAGLGNHTALFVVQAIIDSLTAIIIYWIINNTSGSHLTGLIAALLYTVNPFTSGNVGTVTSETLTPFLVALSLLTGILFIKNPSVVMGILLGFCTGITSQAKPAVTIGSLVILITVFLWIKWKSNKIVFLGIILGVILTLVYPLYTNWRDYRELTPFKVDSFYAMEFYNGATLKKLPPFAQSWDYPKEQQIMWTEYWSEYFPGRTPKERHKMAKKYTAMAWNVIRTDPLDYIRWRFFKMWYVWQKENIYPYTEPGYDTHRTNTFWGNTLLLYLAALGALKGYLADKHRLTNWLWITTIGILVSQTLAFSFSHAESRLTLPLYPLIYILAATGITGWRSKRHKH